MSLNSYATPDGGEIGRSQAVQAAAAMTAPKVEMNPVLLKPEGEGRSQLVVMGQPWTVASVREYYELKPAIWETVTSALARLRADYDVVVIEGVGSPAEVNLKSRTSSTCEWPSMRTRRSCWWAISTVAEYSLSLSGRWCCLSRRNEHW